MLIKAIRPLLGPYGCCRYAYSCYDFAIEHLQHQPLLTALLLIIKRVLSCNPLYSLLHSLSNSNK